MGKYSVTDSREQRPGWQQWRGMTGLTLIELLITISIASLLIALAAPGFRDVVTRQRLSAQVQQLHTSLILARSEAVKRGRSVTLCPRVTGTSTCMTDYERWESGWLLFLDTDADLEVDEADGEEIIRFYDQADGLQIQWNRSVPLTYDARGFLSGMSGGTFTICDPATEATLPRAIIVSMNGRPRVSDTTSGGAALQCETDDS